MSNEWMYLVFVLLYTLAESLPVNDLKIDQLLQTCSLNISSTVNVKKFKELCSETQNAVDFKVILQKFLYDGFMKQVSDRKIIFVKLPLSLFLTFFQTPFFKQVRHDHISHKNKYTAAR